MNIKREAYDKIIERLRREISTIDYDLKQNIRKFRDLEQKQAALKRQKTEIVKLINIVEGDKPKEG
jgi:hypothetical protein